MSLVLVTPRAEQDLEEIGDYIAVDNTPRARALVQEIRARFRQLEDAPLAHPHPPELGDAIRVCLLGRYTMYFTFESSDDAVVVVRIIRGARDLLSLLEQSL